MGSDKKSTYRNNDKPPVLEFASGDPKETPDLLKCFIVIHPGEKRYTLHTDQEKGEGIKLKRNV